MCYNASIQINAIWAVSNSILWNIGFHRKTEVQFIFLLVCPSHQKNRLTTDFFLDMIPKEDESAITFCCCVAVWKELEQVFERERARRQWMPHKQWIVGHAASERDGRCLNDDKQQWASESFHVSVRHRSNNNSLFVFWESVNLPRKHFQLDWT